MEGSLWPGLLQCSKAQERLEGLLSTTMLSLLCIIHGWGRVTERVMIRKPCPDPPETTPVSTQVLPPARHTHEHRVL